MTGDGVDPPAPATAPPAHPQYAPGSGYWDGTRWVEAVAPTAARARSKRRARVLVSIGLVLVALTVGGVFVVVNSAPGHLIRNGIASGGNKAYYMQSESMQPALEVGDRVGATTKFGAIRRGDVIAFRSQAVDPSEPARPLLKRVVGLPGETIEATGGQVVVNGEPRDEPYLAPDVRTESFVSVVVPADSYFVLGDNRNNSKDSRFFGAVPASAVLAIALRVISPQSHAGRIPGSPR